MPDFKAIQERLRDQFPRGLSLEEALEEQLVLDIIWKEVKQACSSISPFKRIKSKEDIQLVSRLEKTSTADVKRYLYQD